MSNTSAVHALRQPMRALQETCASLLGVKRAQATSGVRAASKRPTDASPLDDDVSTQWLQTTWSETSFDPRLP